jgi:type I restriction-modification system DNA methylase subunit
MTKEKLIKSKKRVKEHGEVFTPMWMVRKMVDLVDSDAKKPSKTFLEPACGDGRFLCEILERRLAVAKSGQESLLAVSTLYGIELLPDNVESAKNNLLFTFLKFSESKDIETHLKAAEIIDRNIVCGNALTKTDHNGELIKFTEWNLEEH